MAERRKTNLHEALQKSQLEVALYKSAYEKEKREKERLLEHFQQVFPSTATGGAEVSPASQIQVLCIFSCFLLGFSLTYCSYTYRFRVALCSLGQLVCLLLPSVMFIGCFLGVARRTFHKPNSVQICSNNGFCSFAWSSASGSSPFELGL